MIRRCSITSSFLFVVSPTRALYPLAFRRGHHPCNFGERGRTRTADLPIVQYRVATARHVSRERSNRLSYPLAVFVRLLSKNGCIIAYTTQKVNGKNHPDSLWSVRALRCGGMNRDFSRSQRNQLGFAVALASEDVSVGSILAVILL